MGRREYGNMYPVAKAIVTPLVRAFWRINVTGMGRVPTEGPAIFCPNHISFFDSVVLPVTLPRRVSYVGKAEYMDSWKTKYVFPSIGMVPIDRSGGDSSTAALDTAARILERGEYFGIYPEGTRSRTGKLYRGHTGPARLSLRTGAPIIPVGIRGTDKIQVPDESKLHPFRSCQVDFGRPIDPARYAGREDDRLTYRQIIDEVMFEIASMTGQEYVDEYANKPKADKAEPAVAEPAPEVPAYGGPTASWPAPNDKVLVTVGAGAGDDDEDADTVIDVRKSSEDVLARWWS